MSYVLFYSFFCGFVIFLFKSLHPSDQSSVQKCSTLCHWSRLRLNLRVRAISLTSLICLIEADHLSNHVSGVSIPGSSRCISGVSWSSSIMLSADPILIVNSQDQEPLGSAHLRTEVAMSNLTISGHSAEDSEVKYAVMASLPNSRMDTWSVRWCQVLRVKLQDVKCFTWLQEVHGNITSALLGHPQWCRQSSRSISSIMGFKFLVSRSQVTNSIGNSITIYHMIYLTVAHCRRLEFIQYRTGAWKPLRSLPPGPSLYTG